MTLMSCRRLLQTMALSGVAFEALPQAKVPICQRKAAFCGALRPGDQRLRQNKTWPCECLAMLRRRINDAAKLALHWFEEGNAAIKAYAKTKFATGGLFDRWTAGCDLRDGTLTKWAGWMSHVLRARGESTAGFPNLNRMKLVSNVDSSRGSSLRKVVNVESVSTWCLSSTDSFFDGH